jgi:hypothetical protein
MRKVYRLLTASILTLAVFAFCLPVRAVLLTLPGHVPAVVKRLNPVGRLDASNRLDLAIGLPLRDSRGLTEFLRELYDPSSTNFHRYLTPDEFTARFGPTEQTYQSVKRFAQANGFAITHVHGNRMLLDVSAAVPDIERAFHITLRTYRHPAEPRNFYAPDNEPSIEPGVPVLDVCGLTDYGKPQPALRPVAAGGKGKNAAGSGPGSAFLGQDFRNAYAPGCSLDASGQMVGLFQLTGYDPNDIFAYEALAGLPDVPLQNVLIDGANNSIGAGEDETCLDIEMTISMATNLAAVVVFEAPNNSGVWNDVLNTMASSNQIKQFSSSWGYAGNPSQTSDQIFQQMAAQGQSFFQASGDGDAWTNSIWEPAESPYVTVVGGTELSMSRHGAAYYSESVWNSGDEGYSWGLNGSANDYWGSGGGVSQNYAIPDWQSNLDMTVNQGSSTMRNIPDVAMTADNIYVTHGSGTNGTYSGTSCAAPLWAGFAALVNEQATGMNNLPAGFLNPAIYALGTSSNYAACFNDITNGDNTWPGCTNVYFAVPGYDLCTGWGTPSGTNLINALAGNPDSLVITPQVCYSSIGEAGGPFNGVVQNYNLYNAGAGAINWSLVNTSSWFGASVAAGSLAPGTETNVAVTLGPGVNSLEAGCFTATVLFTNETSQIAQPRTFTLQVGQSLVQDGGFESGTFSHWNLAGNTIAGGYIYDAVECPADPTVNFPMVAHSGNYGAFLGDLQMAYLSQTLPTCPGQLYLFSFWLDNPGSSGGQQFQAAWNTNASSTNVIYAMSNPPVFGWTNLNYLVTAAGSSTVIQFGAENSPNYFGLDDVSVTPVPPPTISGAAQSTNGFEITWNALANVSYAVQYTTNLFQPVWLNLGPSVVASTNTLTETDTNAVDGAPQQFYRIIVSQ